MSSSSRRQVDMLVRVLELGWFRATATVDVREAETLVSEMV